MNKANNYPSLFPKTNFFNQNISIKKKVSIVQKHTITFTEIMNEINVPSRSPNRFAATIIQLFFYYASGILISLPYSMYKQLYTFLLTY